MDYQMDVDVEDNLMPPTPLPQPQLEKKQRILPLTPHYKQWAQQLEPHQPALQAFLGDTAGYLPKPRPPPLKVKRKSQPAREREYPPSKRV